MEVVNLRSLLPTRNQTMIKYWPECTRLSRCTGCCNSEKFECKATKIDVRMLRLTKLSYSTKSKRFVSKGKVPLLVDEHRECKCACRNSDAASCSDRFQMFDEKTCACACTNKSDQRRCSLSKVMSWNPETCKCNCTNVHTCSKGMIWHSRKCVCLKV